MALQIGDTVRFLNDVGGGKIVRIKDNIAYVADEDGFETPVMARECVVVAHASDSSMTTADTAEKYSKTLKTPEPAVPSKAADPEPVEEKVYETAEGDTVNLVLAFEPTDRLRLSQSDFEAYIVNDSNYFMYLTLLTRGDLNTPDTWTTHYAGIIEPNMQVLVASLTTADLPQIERFAVQAIAFKRDKDFTAKTPVWYESRFDASKFARLHCFKESIYFDAPVIAYDIVKDDKLYRPAALLTEETLAEKIPAKPKDIRPARKPVSKKAQKHDEPLVVDLHIDQLIDSTKGLSNADMLNYQIDKFREVMDANLSRPGSKIVFIHGKGEGVLRNALLKELNYRYKFCTAADASFREYGYDATQITIGVRPKK